MLQHTGKNRTFRHNLRLAILLCLTAGFVNAAGFLAFLVLTTNVTGHAALLAVKLVEGDLRAVRMVALWLFLFLAGAFLSSLYILKTGRHRAAAYTLPLLCEAAILIAIGRFGSNYDHTVIETELFAGLLLFAMGMQNALVSVISGAAVRTTHLTGIFTDLGIDLSAMILAQAHWRRALNRRIYLRIVIIFFFLAGGLIGGFAFRHLGYWSFYFPSSFVLLAVFYDQLRMKWQNPPSAG